jgi:transposase
VLVTTDPALRESPAGLSRWMLVRRCAELDTTDPHDTSTAAIYTLRLLGRRILRLGEEIRELEQHITTAVNACAPALLHRRGIGHDSAAALLLTAGDNPERLDTEASFAVLCGTNPIEASSGKTQRRRLNRGGDRQANAALYRIVLTHLRCHPSTQEYLQRRLAEGKTRREVIRCLKRYLAREVYPLLRQVWTTPEHHALTA